MDENCTCWFVLICNYVRYVRAQKDGRRLLFDGAKITLLRTSNSHTTVCLIVQLNQEDWGGCDLQYAWREKYIQNFVWKYQ